MTPATPANGILILGAAKSGTTALFYALKQSLAARGMAVEGLFEPVAIGDVMSYAKRGQDGLPLVKMLLGPFLRSEAAKRELMLQRFDRSIVIYRDPRDNVVSRLVFFLVKFIKPRDTERLDAVMALFRQKEQDPESISVVGIVRRLMEITGQPWLLENMRSSAVVTATLKREDKRHFMMPFEDLAAKRFDDLERYLGFPLLRDFEVEQRHSNVVRTKGSGGWKDWFLPEDIDYFVRPVADDFRTLGYDPDELPNASKQIDPAACSAYVAAQFRKMQGKQDEKRSRRQERAQVPDATPVPVAAAVPPQVSEAERERRREKRQRKVARRGAAAPQNKA